MRILINISNHLVGGGLQVAESFLKECVKFPTNEYHVVYRSSLKEKLGIDKISAESFIFHELPDLKLHQLSDALSKLEKEINPEVVFSVFGPTYWHSKAPQIMGYAIPHYIYPESPYWKILAWKERLKLRLKEKIHLYFIKRDATSVICETTDASTRISNKLKSPKKKYFTVSNTFGQQFLNNPKTPFSGKLPEKTSADFWLLTISSFYPHKNLSVIPAVLDSLKNKGIQNINFILTIPQEDYERIIPERYRRNVHTLGFVNMEECPDLYEKSDAVFLPTLLECFSANYPEAMISQRPLLTSDLSFARSVCEDAALYFNPLNPEDIAKKIQMVLTNPELRKKLVTAGSKRVLEFPNAEERARRYLEICKEIIEDNK
ncbi:MAG: glycosyltransferase family 4 protein [Bacteroides sp.]|nr:glycosyltransferase family 4 protein [Bacteroides sp.]